MFSHTLSPSIFSHPPNLLNCLPYHTPHLCRYNIRVAPCFLLLACLLLTRLLPDFGPAIGCISFATLIFALSLSFSLSLSIFLLLDSSEPTVARLLHRYLSTSPYPHLFFWLLRSSSLLTICVYLCVLGPCCGSYPPNYIIFVSRAPVCFRTAAHGSDPGPGPQRRMSPCPRSSTARHAQCQDQPSPRLEILAPKCSSMRPGCPGPTTQDKLREFVLICLRPREDRPREEPGSLFRVSGKGVLRSCKPIKRIEHGGHKTLP